MPAPIEQPHPAADGGPFGRARIMIVEDEHLVALDLLGCLEQLGHEPVVAYSGEEAVETVLSTPLDLVLMDIKLDGELDGIEAALVIRDLRDVPIVYLTAYADHQTLERARVTEPYGYILKPFQVRELEATVEMTLQRHTSDRRRQRRQQIQVFLSDATARMAATLDVRTVASSALESLVPRQADWCMLVLHGCSESMPAVTFTKPGGEPGLDATSSAPIVDTLRHGAQFELTAVPDLDALGDALGKQHLARFQEIGARSLIRVPVFTREHVIGALVLVAGRDRRLYGPEDLAVIEDFGHRLGISLDNALLYRKAEAAIRMRDDVLAIVSHDLRTPLGSILVQAESLLDHPEVASVGTAIAHASQRMNRLIGDLLDASAVNVGQLSLDVQHHVAGHLVAEAVEMFRTQSQARDIELVTECADRAVRVRCDADRIIQVLSNLLDNALKFTSCGGRVVVAVVRQPAGVRFEVRDTGRGIPDDQLPRLFDRFWRAQAHRVGAGLGLFIARGIVAAHGSELAVESRIGEGTRFSFVLPEGST